MKGAQRMAGKMWKSFNLFHNVFSYNRKWISRNLKKKTKKKSFPTIEKNFFYKMAPSHTCNTERKKQRDEEVITFPYNLYTDFWSLKDPMWYGSSKIGGEGRCETPSIDACKWPLSGYIWSTPELETHTVQIVLKHFFVWFWIRWS